MLEKKKQFSWRGQLPPLPPRYVRPCEACGLQDDVTLLCLASSTIPRRRNLLVALAQYIVTHFRSSSWFLSSLLRGKIRHFRNEKVAGAEMRPSIVFGIVTEDVPVGYWRP